MSGTAPSLLWSIAPPPNLRGPSEDGRTAIEHVSLKEVTSPQHPLRAIPPPSGGLSAAHLLGLERQQVIKSEPGTLQRALFHADAFGV